jgi:hypothetical protein
MDTAITVKDYTRIPVVIESGCTDTICRIIKQLLHPEVCILCSALHIT